MKSDFVKKGTERAPHRSLFNAAGYTDEELLGLSILSMKLFQDI